LLSEDGMLHIIASAGYKPELISEFAHFSVDHDFPLSHAIKHANPIVLRTEEERDVKYPHLVESRRAVGAGAAAAIPMVIDGKVVGGLGFNFPIGRVIDDDDVNFMTTLAHQCAQGNARSRVCYAARK